MLSNALIITRREVKDSLRDWRITTPILLLTIAFPWLMLGAAQLALAFAQRYDPRVIYFSLVPFSVMIVGFFPISFCLVIALETFVGEKERASLEPLLAMPISDTELYLGKLLASMALPLVAAFVGIAMYVIGLWWTTGLVVEPILLLQVSLLTSLEALVMVAGAVVVSSHTTSVRAANLLASFIIIPMTLLVQLESIFLLYNRPGILWYIMIILAVSNVVIVRMGVRLFNREEILAREMDELSLRRVWASFRTFLVSSPLGGGSSRLTLTRLYRHDIPQLLSLNRVPIAMVLLTMLIGTLIGWGFALRYPLPPGLLRLDDLTRATLTQELQQMPSVGFLPQFNTFGIFTHNVRALLLATLLAVFSFGTLALMLLMIPMALIGFFAGEAALLGYDPFVFLGAFILPHGLLELPAAIIATAFAVRLGASLMATRPGLSVGENLLAALADFVKVFVFVVLPLLLIAAFAETNITPQIVLWAYGR